MLNQTNVRVIGAVVLLAVLAIVIAMTRFRVAETVAPSPAGDGTAWLTYTNTKYGYRISYPENVLIQKVAEEDPSEIQATSDLSVGNVEIAVSNFILSQLLAVSGSDYASFANKDPKSFAQAVWLNEKRDTNPNKSKTISDVMEVTFASVTAYSFTERQSDTDFALQDAAKKGLPKSGSNKMYTFYFLRNPKDGKTLSISVTDDSVAQKIVDSFEFVEASTSAVR